MTGQVGQVIDGRFELLAPLGSGGMGTVWRARDLVLEREVALKEVRTLEESGEEADVAQVRVRREAQALARLSHPNVVGIHHLIEDARHPWLVMELVQGQSLDALVRARGPLPPAQVAGLGRDINRALQAAHEAGVHHRDVKPANVIIRPDGTAVLTDFGIAAMAGDTHLTKSGMVIGSPEFMAPERLRGEDDLDASDLYSLGMLMLVAADGRNPLRRSSPIATLAAVLNDPPPTPQHAGALAPLITRLLERDPSARPSTAAVDAELARLDRARPTLAAMTTQTAPGGRGVSVALPKAPTAGPAPSPAPPAAPPPAPSGRGRRTVLVAFACAILVAGGVGLASLLGESGDPASRAAGTGSTSTSPTTDPARTTSTPDRESTTGDTSPASPRTTGTGADPRTGTEPAEAEQTPRGEESAPEEDDPAPREEEPAGSSTRESVEQAPPAGALRSPGNGAWIAQLASVPVASGTKTRDARLRQIRASFPEAAAFTSSRYASLRSGYWVIWAGPYADGNAALSACHGAGLGSGACIGRLVSSDASDRRFVCSRSGSSGCAKD